MYGATIGRVAILGIEASSNQAVCHIIPDDEVADRSYLFYALRQNVPFWLNQGVGGAQPNISQQIIRNTKIPLPPLEEQKRIAAILDKADAIRRKRKEAIALTEELVRSTFLDMFGDPITNPKGWKIDELGKYISHSNNGLSRRRKTLENEGYIVLRLQDVREEHIIFDEPNRIALDEKEKQRYLLEAGDLLFIRVNGNKEYVGRCAVYRGFNEDVYHNDHLSRWV
jgi:type I restriction enzyme S subunit